MKKIIEAESRPIQVLRDRRAKLEAVRAAWKQLGSALSALRSALFDLKLESTYAAKKAVSSAENLVSAAASSSATEGIYTVSVTQLAQAHTIASDPQTGSDTPLGLSGSFTINGTSVSVGASDTLRDIAGKINGTSGIGVLASVVDNRLILKSRTSGTSGAITIEADPDGVLSSLGVVNPGTTTPKNVLQAAQDAVLTVDGLTVTRSSNTVADVLPGVTLELRAVTSSPVTVTVSRDISSAREKVKAWVEKYNAVVDAIARLEAGTLKGDPLLARIKLSLRSRIAREASGLSPYRNLYQIGISTGGTWQGGTLEEAKSGKLRVDDSKLTSALETDPGAVRELFFASDPAITGIGEALEADLRLWLDTGGFLPSRDSTISAQEKRIDDQIAAWQRILDHREKVLLQQFVASEQILLSLQQQGQYLQQRLNLLLSGAGV